MVAVRSPAAILRREAESLADRLPPLMAEAERVAAAVAQGVHGRRRSGIGESFWQYRNHRYEDGAASVDWRRSARGDHLYVRENEWEAANSVYVWRDGGSSMDFRSTRRRPKKKDRAAVLLIALATLLTRGGERVAVLGESAAPRAGRVGLDRAAMRLATGKGAAKAFEATEIARWGRVVLASDFYEPPEVWASRIALLTERGAGGAILQVCDPAEEDFPYQGRTLFHMPGGGDSILFGRAESAGPDYRRRFSAQRKGISDITRRAGFTFISHRTDQSPAKALLSLYMAIGPDGGSC